MNDIFVSQFHAHVKLAIAEFHVQIFLSSISMLPIYLCYVPVSYIYVYIFIYMYIYNRGETMSM